MFHILRNIGKSISFIPAFLRKFIFESTSKYSNSLSLAIRYIILSSFVKDIGINVYIGKNVTFKNSKDLIIGNFVSIHDNCYIDAYGGIVIGNDVSIAHNSSLMSFDHTWGNKNKPIKYNHSIKKELVISDDVWIGAGCRILGGTTIKKRVVVAAGAVAKGLLDSEFIYGGVPAKKLKEL